MSARVLVVDDEPSVRHSLAMILESWGHSAETAANAEEGLRKARNERFLLIILDYSMPGKNGLEVLPELREAAPGAAVLMLTGFGTPEVAKEALRRGAAQFLHKPIELVDLHAAVRRCIGQRGGDGMLGPPGGTLHGPVGGASMDGGSTWFADGSPPVEGLFHWG